MKTLTDKLSEIINYYKINRCVGHTTAAVKGVQNVDSYLITHNYESGTTLTDNFPRIKTLSINQLYSLRGSNKPIVFDNATLQVLLEQCLNTIKDEEKLNIELDRKIQDQTVEIKKLKTDIDNAKKINPEIHPVLINMTNATASVWNDKSKSYIEISFESIKTLNNAISNLK